MDKCLKILGLFNKRAKILYFNGYSKFQISSELQLFLEKQDKSDLTTIDLCNLNNHFSNDKIRLDRNIKQHYCDELYFKENTDDLFLEINNITKNIKYDTLKDLPHLDEFLDNPRIKQIKDITLSNMFSFYEKPFFEKLVDKEYYLRVINQLSQYYKNNNLEEKEYNLLLCENEFLYLDYVISNVIDRIDIYQELVMVITQLASLYKLDDEVMLKYLGLYLNKMIKDLLCLNDIKKLVSVIKVFYNNIDFSSFLLFFPFFTDSFSPNFLKEILKEIEADVFFKKDETYQTLKNILIFTGGDLDSYIKVLDESKSLSTFNKDISLLEFSIYFCEKTQIQNYFNKVQSYNNLFGYEEVINRLKEVVDNFDRIDEVYEDLKKLTNKNIIKILIETEQLNYFNQNVFSCALDKAFNYYFDYKSLNFEFLLFLLNLGIEDKAAIYFYHNINYIDWEKINKKNVFVNANMLFMLNCFDLSSELLSRLKVYLIKVNQKNNSKLLRYVTLQLQILEKLMIPKLNQIE